MFRASKVAHERAQVIRQLVAFGFACEDWSSGQAVWRRTPAPHLEETIVVDAPASYYTIWSQDRGWYVFRGWIANGELVRDIVQDLTQQPDAPALVSSPASAGSVTIRHTC